MPGHMFQIFGAVIAAVSPRVLRTWYPKTVEEKFCLGAFGMVKLGRFVEMIKMNINFRDLFLYAIPLSIKKKIQIVHAGYITDI